MFSTIAIIAQTAEGQQGSTLGMFLPMILIFVVMWMLIFRPQARKQKEHQIMLGETKKGDNVLTVGGIYGSVVGFKENDSIVVLKIDDGCKVDLLKSSIAKNISAEARAQQKKVAKK